MTFAEILLIAVGLAMDAFAVSLGVGTTRFADSARPRFRLAWHFGLFQALMPTLGWLVGSAVERLIAPLDHWIALGLLAFVGVRMIRSGLSPDEESHPTDPSRGGTLVLLSVATSIDAFAVGLSLAVLGVPIAFPAVVIGIVTGSLSLIGLLAGNRLGKTFGKRMEIVGGVILIGIGIRIVVSICSPAVWYNRCDCEAGSGFSGDGEVRAYHLRAAICIPGNGARSGRLARLAQVHLDHGGHGRRPHVRLCRQPARRPLL